MAKRRIAKKPITKLQPVAAPRVRGGVLEIEFSGLCAVVVNRRAPGDATEARVLLVDGARVLGFTPNQVAAEGRGWSARLCVPRANLDEATPADETLETYGGEQIAVWRFGRSSTLTIDNHSGDPLVVRSGSRQAVGGHWKNGVPSPAEPPEDISWVPEMARIVPGAGKLKNGLWNGWGGSNGPLCGKVILTSGLIEAIQPSHRTYAFQDDNGNANMNYRQYFANGIRIRIWLGQRKAKLTLTEPTRKIELVERPEYEPIRATITNHSGSSDQAHTAVGDPHFKAFYALSQSSYGLSLAHRLSPVEAGGGVIHSKVRPCMGVIFYE